MTKLAGKLKIYLFSGYILTALGAILGSLLCFFYYDPAAGYFNPAFPVSFFTGLCIVSVLWFLSFFVFAPKKALDGATPLTLHSVIPSGVMAIILIYSGSMLLYSYFTQAKNTLALAAACLLLLASAYFIFNCFSRNGSRGDLHALSGFPVPFACALVISVSYFDTSVSMNAPEKAGVHLPLILFMLFILFELRSLLRKPMPRCYFAFGLITMFLAGSFSVPAIIAFFADIVTRPDYLLYNIISLGIAAYVAVRLYVFVSARSLLERISDQTPVEPEPLTVEPEPLTVEPEPLTDDSGEQPAVEQPAERTGTEDEN